MDRIAVEQSAIWFLAVETESLCFDFYGPLELLSAIVYVDSAQTGRIAVEQYRGNQHSAISDCKAGERMNFRFILDFMVSGEKSHSITPLSCFDVKLGQLAILCQQINVPTAGHHMGNRTHFFDRFYLYSCRLLADDYRSDCKVRHRIHEAYLISNRYPIPAIILTLR